LISNVGLSANKITQLSIGGPARFIPPKVNQMTLTNGLKVYYIEDHSAPIVQGKVLIRCGSVYEDMDKIGVSAVLAGLLKDGGTANYSPEALREKLDQLAIDISFSSSSEVCEGGFSALSGFKGEAIDLLFEMIFKPAFDRTQFEIIKKRKIDGIKRDMEVSGPIAHKMFRAMIYGDKNRWGISVKPSDIKNLRLDDVKDVYNKQFSPDRMMFVMAGDFNKDELMKKLKEVAAAYPKREAIDLKIPTIPVEFQAEEKFISKKFTQSAINIGHLGTTRNNPDKYALILMNDMFGGGASFTNRLVDSVRVKAGLAYEVWSDFTFGPPNAPGLFQIHMKTRNKTVNQAIEIAKEELKKMIDNGFTKDEFKRSKDGILNKMIFEYERPFDIALSTARFAYFGYPDGYIEIYRRGIEKTTLQDVNNVAKKYLHSDKLKIVIVGKKS
jgi:zinc protease